MSRRSAWQRVRGPLVDALTDRRLVAGALVLLALCVVALVAPHPSLDQIREWSRSLGPAFPAVFVAVHALVTIAPIPRTLFTLSAGVLFGVVGGVVVAVVASTISAVAALLLVRYLGRGYVEQHLTHPAARAIDERLARRGWLAVGSLRLIAPVPFAVVNYCAGVSAVRVVPYTVATLIGMTPGTVGVVLLGDALTGHTDPRLIVVSGLFLAVGVVGLVLDAKVPVRHNQRVDLDSEESSQNA